MDPITALADEIEELKSQLALSRSASRANWRRFIDAQQVIYDCFRWMDSSLSFEQLEVINQHADWYNKGCDIIGWNFDYASREARYKDMGT